MLIFKSLRNLLIAFVAVVILVAITMWLYLNVQASMQVSAKNAQIQLADQLPTTIDVGNHLQVQAQGGLKTELKIDRKFALLLQGKYLANLSFATTTPIKVDIDYATNIDISTVMPLNATTDLIYQNKLLPTFPIQVDIPVKLSVPFKLKRSYQLPINIQFNGPVDMAFDETLNVDVNHTLTPMLNINDPMTMQNIARFSATMHNTQKQSRADLDLNIDLLVKNIRP